MTGVVRMGAVWGADTLLETLPPVERLRDALYLPWALERPWGLFDRHGLAATSVWELEPQGSPVPPVHTAYRIEQPAAADPAAWAGAEVVREGLTYAGRMHLHFGHFLLETLNRFWSVREGGLNRARFLVHGPKDLDSWFGGIPWTTTLFGAMGLSRANFVWADHPLRCRRLSLPHPSFRPQSHAHRAFGDLCGRIGSKLLAGLDRTPDPRPAYLSKSRLSSGVIRVANEAEVEAVLARAGVEIVHPQTLPLAEQVALFARRRVVLGTTGSAFHLNIFAPPEARLIRLSPAEMINSNHLLLDRLGGRTDAVYLHQPGTTADPHPGPWTASYRLPDPAGAAEALLEAVG